MARPVVSQFKEKQTRHVYEQAQKFRQRIGLTKECLRTYMDRVEFAILRNDIRTAHLVLDEFEKLIHSLEFGENDDGTDDIGDFAWN